MWLGRHAMLGITGVIIGFGVIVAAVSARPIMPMSLTEQMQKSSLVVIGVPVSTEDEGKVTPNPPIDETVSVLTLFDVEAVVQGNLPPSTNNGRNQVTVRHRRFIDPRAEIEVVDGPLVVEFNPRKKNRYLMFLKLDDEGVFSPITGQYDSAPSFSQLKPYHVSDERESHPGN